MKIRTVIISFVATLCLIGCSKEGGCSSTKAKRLVPATAAEVMASPDYKLEHTTKAGIKLYVRELKLGIANTITLDSPDHEFLNGGDQCPYYFVVMIRDGKIIDTEAATASALKAEESGEIIGFTMERDKKVREVMAQAPRRQG